MSSYRSKNSYRLKGFDYRNAGYYFITLNTKNRNPDFGKIQNGIMGLTEIGCIAYQCWYEMPEHFSYVILDEFIVMPDHIHFLIYLKNEKSSDREIFSQSEKISRCVQLNTPTDFFSLSEESDIISISKESENQKRDREYYSKISPLKKSLSVVIRTYKGAVKRWCNENGLKSFEWQRNFYDRIVWNETAIFIIGKYIRNNPIKWQLKEERKNKLQSLPRFENSNKDKAA